MSGRHRHSTPGTQQGHTRVDQSGMFTIRGPHCCSYCGELQPLSATLQEFAGHRLCDHCSQLLHQLANYRNSSFVDNEDSFSDSSESESAGFDDRETLIFSLDVNANEQAEWSSTDDDDDDDDGSNDDREPLSFSLGARDDRERLQPNSVNTQYQDWASSHHHKKETRKDSPKEIPGFYYDTERQQYFKVSHNPYNTGSACYTPEKIKSIEAEQERVKSCNSFANRPAQRPACVHSSGRPHLPGLMCSLQTRGMNSHQLRLDSVRCRCANLKLSASTKPKMTQHRDEIGQLEEILATPSFSKVLCLWETADRENHYAQLMSVRGKTKEDEPELSLQPWGHCVFPLFDKITCIRMAPSEQCEDRVVYTVSDPQGQALSTVNLKNLDNTPERGSVEDPLRVEYKLKHTVAYTCAWNSHQQRASVGTHRKALIVDMERRSQEIYKTHNADPLSQTFHSKDVFSLLSGTRGGSILRHDTRSGSLPIREWQHGHSVGHLHSMASDDNILLASDIKGKICQYDTRQDGVVRNFEGLANTHKLLPFQLDESESILNSTGTDCFTCLWDVKSGELLVRIPPPLQVTPGYMPRAVFSSQWASGLAGTALIMGMRNQLMVYH